MRRSPARSMLQPWRVFRVAAAGAVLSSQLFSQGSDGRAELHKLQEERAAVEAKLETARRRIPPAFEPADEEKFFKQVAGVVELDVEFKPLEGAEVVAAGDGRASQIRIHRGEVSGKGRLQNVHDFLEFLESRRWRLTDLEWFEAAGGDGDRLRFTARFIFPTLAVTDGPDVSSFPGGVVAYVRESLARARAELEVVEGLIARSESGRVHEVATVLDLFPGSEGLALTKVRLDDLLRLDGAVVGAAARADLARRAAALNLRGARLQIAEGKACRPFSIGAPAGQQFDPAAVALCSVGPQHSLGRVAVRGKAAGADAIDVRLRDADVATVFMALHDVAGANFVIDRSVSREMTVDLDVGAATLEQTLAAMKKAGLAVASGSLRRVFREGQKPTMAKSDDWAGEPVSLSLRDVSLRDILCLFGTISGLELATAPDLPLRTAVFTREVPWDQTLAEVIASAGLTYAIEGTRVLVGAGASSNACQEEQGVSRLSDIRPRLEELGTSDIELLGVARTKEGWKAYAYGPFRQLLVFAAGQRLFDAQVRSVSRSGVTFATDSSGVVTMSLDEPPP